MSTRERNYLVGCLGASLLFGFLAYLITHKYPGWAGAGLVAGGLAFLAGLVFEPVREALKVIFREFPNPRCHLMLFGPAGNGKTQVFRCLRELPYCHGQDTTVDFETDWFDLRVGQDESQTKFRVKVADYPGQEPYVVLGDIAPKSFFGSRYSRRIDVIFIIVDLFPIRNAETMAPMADTELVELSKSEGQQLVQDRVRENLEYYNSWSLQFLFAKVWSERHKPYAVRLLINKVDLLVDAVNLGYISLPTGMRAEDYALRLYSSLIDSLNENCRAFGIQSFVCEPISVKEDNGRLRRLLGEILEKRLRRKK
jgi:hypothetical protein